MQTEKKLPFTKTGEGRDARYEIHVPKTMTTFWNLEGWAWWGGAPEKWIEIDRRKALREDVAALRDAMAQPRARFSPRFWEAIEWLLAAIDLFLRGEIEPELADSAAGALASLEGYYTRDYRYVRVAASTTLYHMRWSLAMANAGFSRD